MEDKDEPVPLDNVLKMLNGLIEATRIVAGFAAKADKQTRKGARGCPYSLMLPGSSWGYRQMGQANSLPQTHPFPALGSAVDLRNSSGGARMARWQKTPARPRTGSL